MKHPFVNVLKSFAIFSLLTSSGCQSIKKGAVGPEYKVLAVSHVDSTGLYWLEKLETDFKNGCMDTFSNYQSNLCSKTIENEFDSDAEKACESYGARLPTIQEYQRLLQDFEPTSKLDKGLSPETYHEVAMAFKDEMPYAAWTSSVRAENITQARYFSWRRGAVQERIEYRSVELPVRCVRRAK